MTVNVIFADTQRLPHVEPLNWHARSCGKDATMVWIQITIQLDGWDGHERDELTCNHSCSIFPAIQNPSRWREPFYTLHLVVSILYTQNLQVRKGIPVIVVFGFSTFSWFFLSNLKLLIFYVVRNLGCPRTHTRHWSCTFSNLSSWFICFRISPWRSLMSSPNMSTYLGGSSKMKVSGKPHLRGIPVSFSSRVKKSKKKPLGPSWTRRWRRIFSSTAVLMSKTLGARMEDY